MFTEEEWARIEEETTLKPGDLPFKEPPPNSPEHSYVDLSRDVGYFRRVEGFGKTALLVVEQALAGELSTSDIDSMGLAALYSFRHYLELALKSLVSSVRLLNEDRTAIRPRHFLMELWVECRDVLAGRGVETESLDKAEACIRQFNDADRGSFRFRYPEDTDSTVNFKCIDLSNLRIVMKRLMAQLDGWETGVDELANQRREALEYEAEYRYE